MRKLIKSTAECWSDNRDQLVPWYLNYLLFQHLDYLHSKWAMIDRYNAYWSLWHLLPNAFACLLRWPSWWSTAEKMAPVGSTRASLLLTISPCCGGPMILTSTQLRKVLTAKGAFCCWVCMSRVPSAGTTLSSTPLQTCSRLQRKGRCNEVALPEPKVLPLCILTCGYLLHTLQADGGSWLSPFTPWKDNFAFHLLLPYCIPSWFCQSISCFHAVLSAHVHKPDTTVDANMAVPRALVSAVNWSGRSKRKSPKGTHYRTTVLCGCQ